MTLSLTDALCTTCGLCCDGTLLADVELAGPAEATRLEILGLEIEDDGAGAALLVLPCGALRGTRCSVYTHRPECCRTFECRLLQQARRGEVTVERAKARIAEAHRRIARVERLLAPLEKRARRLPLRERCAEALAGDPPAGPAAKRKRAELDRTASALERLLRTTFLDSGRPRPGEPA